MNCTEPSPDPGRRRIQAVARGEHWYCLEEIPCSRTECIREPDLHGPYWFLYLFEKKTGSWHRSYLGREEVFDPVDPDPEGTIAREVECFFTIEEPTQADFDLCRKARIRLSALMSEEAKALDERLRSLYDAWYELCERRVDERFHELSRKCNLTPAEREEIDKLSEILSSQH